LVLDQPTLVEPRVELAALLASAGDLERAIEQLSATIAIAQNPTAILVNRGAFHAQMGQTKEAEQDFREAIRRDVSYYPAYRYLGVTRLRLGAAGEAIEVLREALSLAPHDPETTLYLGEALLTHGNLEDAQRVLAEAVVLLPADSRGFKLLGRLFDRLGLSDEAMEMHRKANEATST
jgi:tetratricopeptide (TPR) repeat protein